MYEAEVNAAIESIESLPLEIRRHFTEFRDRVVARTTLPWGEHCTECVFPTCYTTCGLYSPRPDGGCRQFVGGMVRLDHRGGLSTYVLKLRFKGWAKLWTVGNLQLRSLAAAESRERLNMAIGTMTRQLPLPSTLKLRVLGKVRHMRRHAAEKAPASELKADAFLVECYNPNAHHVSLTLTLRSASNRALPFQTEIVVPPGYLRARIPFEDIARAIDLAAPFEVEIVPNDAAGLLLYFGLMDFVKERDSDACTVAIPDAAAKWKCIVWDLDNTVWDGMLVERGAQGVRVKEGVAAVIRETDQRGILHSIASKNNHDDAMTALKAQGLADYFLHPQIGWQPKSEAIARVAALLNIGVDSIAFVDDQPFERGEVAAALPTVAVVDAADCVAIPGRSECQVPVTDESRRRRQLYREQETREVAIKAYGSDYMAFLSDCRLEIGIGCVDEGNFQRVYELTQRTNQMNFSGSRYLEAQLRNIVAANSLENYVIDCRDRFGDYGIVGFAVVDTSDARLLDLMFSCRIQAKRVEHAVLTFLLRRFVSTQSRDFHANFRRTPRNAAAGRVFEEMGFEVVRERDGVTSFVFRHGQSIPDDRIVAILTAPGIAREQPPPSDLRSVWPVRSVDGDTVSVHPPTAVSAGKA